MLRTRCYRLRKLSRKLKSRKRGRFSSPRRRRAIAEDNCLSRFSPRIYTRYIHLYTPARGTRKETRRGERGVKREVVILPGLVPGVLVKLPCGLIIINREGRHDLRYKLSAALDCRYGYFCIFFIGEMKLAESTVIKLHIYNHKLRWRIVHLTSFFYMNELQPTTRLIFFLFKKNKKIYRIKILRKYCKAKLLFKRRIFVS